MRGAVVNWFAKVSVSYNFANETVVAALSHFDRSVRCSRPPTHSITRSGCNHVHGRCFRVLSKKIVTFTSDIMRLASISVAATPILSVVRMLLLLLYREDRAPGRS